MEETNDQIPRRYTLHFILKPSTGPDEANSHSQSVAAKISVAGGKVETSLCSEQARRLAYLIQKEQQGYLCECVFQFAPEKIKALDDDLRQDNGIMRHVIELKHPIKAREKSRAEKARRRRISASEDKSATASRPQGEIWTPKILDDGIKKPESAENEKRDKVSIEEIDKKLDEIIKNI